MVLPSFQQKTSPAVASSNSLRSCVESIITDPQLIAKIPSEDSLRLIKRMYCKDCTDEEFARYMYFCYNCRLDPMLGYVYCLKYQKDKPAQIFLGKRGMLTLASRNKMFDGIKCDIYFKNPNIVMCLDAPGDANTPASYSRVELGTNKKPEMYAFCEVYRKDLTHPVRVDVKGSEYHRGNEVWNSKLETMLKKVAMSQALEQAFPDEFAMACAPEEFGENEDELMPNADNGGDSKLSLEDMIKSMSIPKGSIASAEKSTAGVSETLNNLPEDVKNQTVKIETPVPVSKINIEKSGAAGSSKKSSLF